VTRVHRDAGAASAGETTERVDTANAPPEENEGVEMVASGVLWIDGKVCVPVDWDNDRIAPESEASERRKHNDGAVSWT